MLFPITWKSVYPFQSLKKLSIVIRRGRNEENEDFQ